MAELINMVLDYGFWIAVVLVIAGVLIFVGLQIRNKMIFTYNHITTRLRNNQKIRTIRNKAGFIKKKGLTYFRLKTGRMPWQYHDLVEHPNLAEVDGDNTVYYTQLGTDIFIQSSKRLIPQIEYSDYMRDDQGELIQMRDEKNNPVFMRDRKGELIYEIVEKQVEDGKIELEKVPVPVYIPIPKDYKMVEEIKPITNIKKAYASAVIADANRAIETDNNWKMALPWVGGIIAIIIITILSYYFLFENKVA